MFLSFGWYEYENLFFHEVPANFNLVDVGLVVSVLDKILHSLTTRVWVMVAKLSLGNFFAKPVKGIQFFEMFGGVMTILMVRFPQEEVDVVRRGVDVEGAFVLLLLEAPD